MQFRDFAGTYNADVQVIAGHFAIVSCLDIQARGEDNTELSSLPEKKDLIPAGRRA